MPDNLTAEALTIDGFVHYYVDSTLDEQETHRYKLANVDMFSNFAFLQYERLGSAMTEYAADKVLSRQPEGEVSEERLFFWCQAARIDSELCYLFEDMEGVAASADKTRVVLAGYDRFLATGKFPEEFPPEGDRGWHLPQHGSRRQWHDIVKFMLWKRYSMEYAELVGEIFSE